jgi:hypothetical protein
MEPYIMLSHYGQSLIFKLKAISGGTYTFHDIEDYEYMCIAYLVYLCYN